MLMSHGHHDDIVSMLRQAHAENEPGDYRQLMLVAADAIDHQKKVIRELLIEVAKAEAKT